jgi:hypothetical protein
VREKHIDGRSVIESGFILPTQWFATGCRWRKTCCSSDAGQKVFGWSKHRGVAKARKFA